MVSGHLTCNKRRNVIHTEDFGYRSVMQMTLAHVLEHPSLAPARPLLRTGTHGLTRPVRWIHSSEVIDIAPLLRGGELLLTGGTALAAATAEEQRHYVRDLAARAVAGVAIEAGPHGPGLPAPLLEEAEALDFPVVELRRVVPFVAVAEAVNSALVNASVTRLRDAGELAHRLSGILADGGGVREVLEELVRHTGTVAVLFDRAGAVIASRSPDETGQEPDETGRIPDVPGPLGSVGAHITVRGAHIATLVMYPATAAAEPDEEALRLAQERAAEALQLALLRSRPPSARDFAAAELVRLAACGTTPARIRQLGPAVGFEADAPVLGLAARAATGAPDLTRLDGVLRRHGLTAVAVPAPLELHALVSLRDRRRAALVRAEVLHGLREWNAGRDVTVTVGPVLPSLAGAPASLGAAVECLGLRFTGAPAGLVVDTTEWSVERLMGGDDARAAVERLVQEQLGMVLALREHQRRPLLATLEAYFATGCNKTRTAAELHLQRQSLYARLERAFDVLGGDPTGTPRALPLHLALRLYRQLD
ncbi:PucR family transcriptional regulator [Streptomyces sp. NTH33]|nr:PucR family transcriptional regulator [Streptomyces sp. NTH33]